jgi:class 3 adenylate cyclase
MMSSTSHGISATHGASPALSAPHLKSLFPFHLMIDEQMRILHYGEGLVRVCPLLATSEPFHKHFDILRPRGIDAFEGICRQSGALYIVRLRSSPIELRGQMVPLQPNLMLFLCSPLVRSISEVESLGLSLQDFPLHDPTGDLLFLLQAQRTTIEDAKTLNQRLLAVNESLKKYVPRDFLRQLDKESIAHVKLGDHVQKVLTVLFADIRSFASLAESMSPQETFDFLNGYLQEMEPVITRHGGFIDKYIGDAIMALFPSSPDDAVQAAVDLLHTLADYNREGQRTGRAPIQIGIGINTGSLILGTIGGEARMEGTVIGDDVNVASRIQDLTKIFGASLLIGEKTFRGLRTPAAYSARVVDHITMRGRSEPITVYEVFDGDAPAVKEAKSATLDLFEKGVASYHRREFGEAENAFVSCSSKSPHDKAVKLYLERCCQTAGREKAVATEA